MAQAIPAAIGLGSSLIGGIGGKGAAKKQQQLAEQQMRQLQPLIDAQLKGTQFSLDQAQQLYGPTSQMFKDIYSSAGTTYDPMAESSMGDYRNLLANALGQSNQLYGQGQGLMGTGQNILGSGQDILTSALPYLTGAGSALNDLQSFYRPFMTDGARAIDRFLPSAERTNQMLAPEFGNVNQGYRSASENIAKFAPRGGGRISSLARADIDRQKQLSDIFTQGRQNLSNQAMSAAFQGAAGQQGVAQGLQSLGLGQGQLGLGKMGTGLQTIGTGLQTIGQGNQNLATGGGLAQNAFGQALQALLQKSNQQSTGASGLGGLATNALNQGLSSGSNIYDLYNKQANRAYGDKPAANNSNAIGGFLVDIFNKGNEWWKNRNSGSGNIGTVVQGGIGPQP